MNPLVQAVIDSLSTTRYDIVLFDSATRTWARHPWAEVYVRAQNVAARARRDGAAVALHAPETLVLPARGDALRRCLANLTDNARKHAGRITLTVERVDELWAQVIVDDDGPGIPPEQREEAFKPFATLSGSSTGLGLAIARDIARAHGGDVILEDSPLGGLRARIRLPA